MCIACPQLTKKIPDIYVCDAINCRFHQRKKKKSASGVGVPKDNTAAADEDPDVAVPTCNIIPTASTDDVISAGFSTEIIAALAGDEQAALNSNFVLFLQDIVPVLAPLDSFNAVSSFTVLNASAADADESDPTRLIIPVYNPELQTSLQNMIPASYGVAEIGTNSHQQYVCFRL